MRIYKDIDYTAIPDGIRKIDLHLPDGECRALLIYFHGGGFVEGSRDLEPMIGFSNNMTESGIGIASVEYRMYPDAKYPDFIEDAAEAIAYVKRELTPLAGCQKLIVCGTSAGGYMSQMLCFNENYLEKHGLSNRDITAYIHDAGQPTAHFNVLKERGIDSRRVIVDESAPLYHVKGDDYPPMQIIVSDDDIPSRLEQTELLISALKSFGYDMKKLTYTKTHGTHVWYVNKADNHGNSAFAKIIIPFINSVI